MNTRTRRGQLARLAAPLLAVAMLLPAAVSVAAAAPSNDDIASPTVISSIPFADAIDTTEATTGPTDPAFCDAPEYGPDAATVWYSFTATSSGPLGATTFGSDYGTTVYVGTADGAGGIDVLACNTLAAGTLQSAVRFDAEAGMIYLFVVGAQPGGGTGELVFTLDVGPPAQVIDLVVSPAGSFTKDGVATVRGTFSCTAVAPGSSGVIVELSQYVGRRLLYGAESLRIENCPGSAIPWAIEVSSIDGRFAGGRASVQVIGVACNDFECINETVDTSISLRR
jgi:hypothetical protein